LSLERISLNLKYNTSEIGCPVSFRKKSDIALIVYTKGTFFLYRYLNINNRWMIYLPCMNVWDFCGLQQIKEFQIRWFRMLLVYVPLISTTVHATVLWAFLWWQYEHLWFTSHILDN
jgi:hypothetical protein